jgi:hypothetical protein
MCVWTALVLQRYRRHLRAEGELDELEPEGLIQPKRTLVSLPKKKEKKKKKKKI